MWLKKLAPSILIIALAVITAFTLGFVSRQLNSFQRFLFDHRLNYNYLFQLFYIGLMALICAIIARKFQVKKWILAPVILIFLAIIIWRSNQQFVIYQQDPDAYAEAAPAIYRNVSKNLIIPIFGIT